MNCNCRNSLKPIQPPSVSNASTGSVYVAFWVADAERGGKGERSTCARMKTEETKRK